MIVPPPTEEALRQRVDEVEAAPAAGGSADSAIDLLPQVEPEHQRPAQDYRLRGLELDTPSALAGGGAAPARDRAWRDRHRKRLVRWFLVVVLVAVLGVAVRVVLIQPYSVASASMSPTLHPGDRVLAVRTNLAGVIDPGDIVVLRGPRVDPCASANARNGLHLVSRVVAVGGQTLWSAGGAIYVNGHKLSEGGWYNPRHGQVGSLPIRRTTVPAGDVFVLSDNRTQSCDSRSFGPVSTSSVVGEVVAIISRSGHPYFHIY